MGNQLTSGATVTGTADLATLLVDFPAFTPIVTLGSGKLLKSVQGLMEEGTIILKLYVKRSATGGGGGSGGVNNPASNTSNENDLRVYEHRLEVLRERFSLPLHPNILPIQRWDSSDKAVVLMRQFFAFNLSDRFHTHPFLTHMEKKWIAYQILCGLVQMHSVGVRHGDIKSENVVCTSWTWLFLTDISFFKPTYLPADNPADYSFFFEGNRRKCYLAPERFYLPHERERLQQQQQSQTTAVGVGKDSNASNYDGGSVTESMDIFSAGCVLAELFMSGDPLFDLPQLLAYREGSYDPNRLLSSKVEDEHVRSLILHMIQLQPSKRFSAKRYLIEWTGRTFPSSFAFLHRLFSTLLSPETVQVDSKLRFLKAQQQLILREVTGIDINEQKRRERRGREDRERQREEEERKESVISISRSSSPTPAPIQPAVTPSREGITGKDGHHSSNPPSNTPSSLLSELAAFTAHLETAANKPLTDLSNKDISTLESELKSFELPNFISIQIPSSTISVTKSEGVTHSALSTPITPSSGLSAPSSGQLRGASSSPSRRKLRSQLGDEMLSGPVDSLPSSHSTALISQLPTTDSDVFSGPKDPNAMTMVTTLICSCIQSARLPENKLLAFELILSFSSYVNDEVRLGRLVPYSVALLSDPQSIIRARALHTLTRLLVQVKTFSPTDAHIFPEYIFPSLSKFPYDTEEIVRLSYAQNIAELAETSRRFLDLSQYMRQVSLRQAQAAAAAAIAADSSAGTTSSNPPPLPAGLPFTASYDTELASLQDTVLKLVIDMITLGGSNVKRMLLFDITRLCIFMGRKRVNTELLPHLISVLNDKDWQLRVAFFSHVIGVSVFVGRIAFQNFVLPCIEQTLIDVEETVIQRAVHALTELCQLGLFEKKTMIEVVVKVAPLLCHPSAWIRNETISFILAMSLTLGISKSHCFLLPPLSPFLYGDILQFTRENLILALKPPLSRAELRAFITGGKNAVPLQTENSINGENNSRRISREESSGKSGGISTTVDGEEEDSLTLKLSTSRSNLSSISSNLNRKTNSIFTTDPILYAAMEKYLMKLSYAFASKSNSTASDSNGIGNNKPNPDEEDELEKYSSLEEEITLNALEIEKTVGDLGSSSSTSTPFSPIDKAQQDLYDSLGVSVMYDRRNPNAAYYANTNINSNGNIDYINPNLSLRPGNVSNEIRRPKSMVRQPLSKVPESIQRALKVPPPPPNLGQLRESTVSNSQFYKNYLQLDGLNEGAEPKNWRPKGVLVATLSEHVGAVTCLSVSRDNLFLVSGGEDGYMRVWDCSRFKLTAAAKSTLTHSTSSQTPPITALQVCDSSHAVALGTSNGTVQVVKVEYADESSHKYAGLSTVKQVDATNEGSIQTLAHFNTVTESLLVYGSQKGIIHGWDLRSKKEAFLLSLPPAMGLLSCMSIGPSPYCLSAGTNRGFICVWDLRFQIPIQVWRHHSKARINNLTAVDSPSILPRPVSIQGQQTTYAHPTKGPLLFAAAESTSQIEAFDLYTDECRLVFKANPPPVSSHTGSVAMHATATATATGGATNAKNNLVTGASASSAAAAAATSPRSGKVNVSPLSLPFVRTFRSDYYPHSLLDKTFIDELNNSASLLTNSSHPPTITSFLCCYTAFVLTAGTDRIVRYWDMRDPIDSYRITTPPLLPSEQLRYTTRVENTTVVMEESLINVIDSMGAEGTASLQEEKLKATLSRASRGPLPPSPAHTSAITDMKAIEFPQRMIATASRDATVKIWI